MNEPKAVCKIQKRFQLLRDLDSSQPKRNIDPGKGFCKRLFLEISLFPPIVTSVII